MYHRSAEADLASITRTKETWQGETAYIIYAQEEFPGRSSSSPLVLVSPVGVTLFRQIGR